MDNNDYQKELEEKLAPLGYNELISDYEARKAERHLAELNARLFGEIRKNYALEIDIGRLKLKNSELTKENRKLKRIIEKVAKSDE